MPWLPSQPLLGGLSAGSWVDDLWLCEHLAHALELPPLEPARIGPAWKVPHGLGRSLKPDEERGWRISAIGAP